MPGGGSEDFETRFANFLHDCDTDADGKVSRAEFTTFFENMINSMIAAFAGAE